MKYFTLATVAALATTLASPAASQANNCFPRDIMVERLSAQYGETLVARALTTGQASVMEIFASEDSESWTVTITSPGGPTCMVAAGQNFQLLGFGEPEPDGDPT